MCSKVSFKVWSPALCFLLLSSLLIAFLSTPSPAQAVMTLQTDQPEYAIGDFATIKGQGFAPGVTVTLEIQRVDNVIDRTEVIAQPDGTFQYVYYLNPNLPDPDAAYRGTLTVRAKVNNVVVATTTFLDNPQWTLQGCSKQSEDCVEKTPGSDWAKNGNLMDGWTSGILKGWFEGENVPYRLRVSLLKNADGNQNYFAVTEHDNLRTGITGIDGLSGFYVGAGSSSVYPEGYLTKSCVQRAAGTGILIPTSGTPCYVSGPTYSGVNDDGYLGDSLIDEDPVDGIDNDGDGRIDEDPPMNGSGSTRMIQYTWAVHFNSDEAGNAKKRWALYWKAHLSTGSNGSSNFPGGSLHADASPSGNQDVPIELSSSCNSADLLVTKTDSPDPVSAGGTITYTVRVKNNGPNAASGVTVYDTLPSGASGVTFVSASGSGWNCTYNGGNNTVTCTRSNSLEDDHDPYDDIWAPNITIVVTAPSPAVQTTITNTAQVYWNGSDPDPSNDVATATTTVQAVAIPVADLSISKVGPPDPGVSAGSNITYTIYVNNLGPQSAPSVTVTDTLPAGTTFVSAGGTNWSCSYNSVDNTVTCTRSTSLGSGQSASNITVVVTAPTPSQPTTVTNSVTVAGPNSNDPAVGNNSAVAETIVSGIAELTIVKTDSIDPVLVNGTLTYTLTVTNNGPSNASGVSVSDTLPSGVAFVSASGTGWACGYSSGTVTCSRASLALGVGPDIMIEVTAPATASTLTNTASVTAFELDTNTGNNSSTITTAVSPAVDLSISKSDSPDPVNAQGTLTYTISVSNAGPSSATGISVTDVLPSGTTYGSASGTGWTCSQNSGTVTCTRTSLGVAAAPDITITVTAPAEGGSISNTATVSANETDTNSGNNVATAGTTVTGLANLSITKTDSPDPVTAGAVLTYTLSVSNAGPSTASNVSVTDTLPSGTSYISAGGTGWSCSQSLGVVTCTRASLAVGAAPNITLTVNAPAEGGSISNTASVSSSTTDPTPGNNSSTQSTTVTASANLSITKSDSPDPVVAGGTLTYTITVNNAGPSTAASLTVTDTLPSGVVYVSAAGTGWSCSHNGNVSVTCTRSSLAVGAAPNITVTVTAPSVPGGIVNTASVSSTTGDPNNSNNSTTASTSVTASVDLSITKTDSPDPVTAGQNLTYTVTVTNNGPSSATGVTVTDTLPAGVAYVSAAGTGWSCSQTSGVVTCTRSASLSVGAASAINIVVTAPAEGGTLSNTASVSGNEGDPDSGNNSATQGTTVTASTDLSITKTDSPDPVVAGQNLTYTVTVTNNGPSTATAVMVIDTLPSGTTFVSAGGTGWGCGQSSGVVTCTRSASLSVGSAPAISIVVTAPVQDGTISNTAAVSGGQADPNSGNNSATASTTVSPVADLSITKTDSPDPVGVGLDVIYTITVTNNGPSPATGVSVTDTLDSATNFVSVTQSQGTCSHPSGTVTCNLGSLSAAGTATITIEVKTTVAGMIGNTATVTGNESDSNQANNTTGIVTTNVGDVSRLINISTRGFVSTGGNIMIGGFILGGNVPKTLLIRGFGPTLTDFGLSGVMTDPKIELFSGSTLVATNDDWQTPVTMCNSPITACGTSQDIINTGKSANSYAPTNVNRYRDAALLVTLPPGAYTVQLSGVNGGTGIGLIGIDDTDGTTLPKLINISTRGLVLTNNDVMIGGFIIGSGTGNKQVLVRAFGPTLSDFGVTGVLANPTLELYDGNGTLFATNNDWQTSVSQCITPAVSCGTPQDIINTGMSANTYAPTNPNRGLDAAILVTLPPGAYTAIVRGVNNGTGVGLVGIDELGQ